MDALLIDCLHSRLFASIRGYNTAFDHLSETGISCLVLSDQRRLTVDDSPGDSRIAPLTVAQRVFAGPDVFVVCGRCRFFSRADSSASFRFLLFLFRFSVLLSVFSALPFSLYRIRFIQPLRRMPFFQLGNPLRLLLDQLCLCSEVRRAAGAALFARQVPRFLAAVYTRKTS